MNRNLTRVIIGVCVLSLCFNGYFVVRHITHRSADYRAMDLAPEYLFAAFASFTIEFNKERYPNTHYQPGNQALQMAFSAFQASQPLYSQYGYNTSSVYSSLDNLRNSSDQQAYHDLSSIKSFLTSRTIQPSEIQPLFNSIAKQSNNP